METETEKDLMILPTEISRLTNNGIFRIDPPVAMEGHTIAVVWPKFAHGTMLRSVGVIKYNYGENVQIFSSGTLRCSIEIADPQLFEKVLDSVNKINV